METIEFTIPGAPVSWARPRFSGKRAYTPKKQLEALARGSYIASRHVTEPLLGPLMVILIFESPRPKRLMGRKHPQGRIPRDKRPDIDNFAKLALDYLEKGGVFADDGQVAGLFVLDYYTAKGGEPKTTVKISRYSAEGGDECL